MRSNIRKMFGNGMLFPRMITCPEMKKKNVGESAGLGLRARSHSGCADKITAAPTTDQFLCTEYRSPHNSSSIEHQHLHFTDGDPEAQMW